MRESIRKRWFPDLSKQATEEAEESSRRRDAIRELISRQAYKDEIRDWLEDTIHKNRPKPGAPENMLTAIGLSEGLNIVKERLDALEREARNDDD